MPNATPEWVYVLSALGLLLPGFFFLNRFTRLGVVARGTLRESIRQPVFLFMLLLAAFLFLLYLFLPFFTLGEDTKVYIDSCLATVLVCSILLAVWTAAQSVAEEREGKTVVTLLSKPITRAQFVLGKYLGIVQAVLVQVLLLGLLLLPAVYYKYGYDQKEGGGGRVEMFTPTDFGGTLSREVFFLQPQRTEAALSVIAPLAMVFLETAVMAAVAVTLSTRVPSLVGMIACFAIFVLGHLGPTLIAAAPENVVFLEFVAQLLSTVFPALWAFDTFTAISTGSDIPAVHLGTIALYSLAYIAALMFVAFLIFEDEDLA